MLKSAPAMPPVNVIIIVIVMCLCSVGAMFFRADTLTWDRAALALLIAWVGFLPGLLYLSTPPEKRAPFPLMPLTGLFYGILFGLTAFSATALRLNETGKIQFFGGDLLDDISITAQLLTLIGMLFMFTSWGLFKRILEKKIPAFTLPSRYPGWRAQVLVWGLIIGNLLYVHSEAIRSLPSVGQFLQPAGFIGFAIMLAVYYRNAFPRWQIYTYFIIALPLWMLGQFASGFLTSLILLAGLWASIHFYHRCRIPWGWIGALVVAFIIIYPGMSFFRGLVWVPGPEKSLVQKLSQVDDAFTQYLSLKKDDLLNRSDVLFQRTGLIFAFSHVVDKTPDTVPYWYGETYRPLFTSWVPRFMWPDKPKEQTGYAFGARYSIIRVTDTNMSYNLPWITELYANFGKIGVVLGMAIIGLFLAGLECFFNRPDKPPLEYGIGAGILISLSCPESNFSLMTGSLFMLTICLWLYFTVGLRLPLPGVFKHLK